MIKTETIIIDGVPYRHTYSNSRRKICRDGMIFDDAIDPDWTDRKYIETNEFIDIFDEEKIEAFDAFVGG